MYGTSSRLTMNPGVSLHVTGDLFIFSVTALKALYVSFVV